MYRLGQTIVPVCFLYHQNRIDAVLFESSHDLWAQQIMLGFLHQHQQSQRSTGVEGRITPRLQLDPDDIRKDATVRVQGDGFNWWVDGREASDRYHPARRTPIVKPQQREHDKQTKCRCFPHSLPYSGSSPIGRSWPPRRAAANAAVTKPMDRPNTATPLSCTQPLSPA